eukprot:CAMPEP_0183812246 /NCGR_PEP_ID=MMETSP0803_2-20130417/50843_1 /TAXON_ID=195967 /ORGANISM="Crustomastix stigmata, Strain CCMP3273" /LENGTH=199 /DNA_ID=CAMNT_0026057087 /DNA_START=9 /DNA_END=605 /DNA_ORIENTATION=+
MSFATPAPAPSPPLEGLSHHEEHVYDVKCAVLSQAYLRRTDRVHPSLPAVVRVDILEAHTLPDGRRRRVRHFHAVNDAPRWMHRFTGGGTLLGTEESAWDEHTGELRTRTTNVSHRHLISAEEVMTFRPDPGSPETRTLKRSTIRARAAVRGWFLLGLDRAIERFLVSRYARALADGRAADMAEMAEMAREGRHAQRYV